MLVLGLSGHGTGQRARRTASLPDGRRSHEAMQIQAVRVLEREMHRLPGSEGERMPMSCAAAFFVGAIVAA